MVQPGSRIGPYEVIAPLGAGGMGEVFRARDPRIGREVAVKVIRGPFASDSDRLRRFEQEARAAGVLNHPNLLTVFELGTHEDAPYIATELLEGSTLRDLLAQRKLSPRKAIEYALQIASGLSAAHERGIVHRDLKPENIFITNDERVKILDFGLAKLLPAADAPSSDEPTAVQRTGEGVVLGTAGYMAPEQVRGAAVDARSDIFALGVVLYEMLAGTAPFRRDSSVETMNAILTADVPPIEEAAGAPLARIIQHMLEKNPAQRFQSSKDLAYALESWSLGDSASGAQPRTRKKRASAEAAKPLKFQRLTFRRGFVMSARFAADGSVIYGASWEDQPLALYASHPATPESRPLGIDGDILSVSPSGELAVSLGRRYIGGYVTTGTLARVPMFGGAARPVLEGVQEAEWARDGSGFLIIRSVGGMYRIELPIGRVIYETPSWISDARLSPRGDLIAFIEHVVWGDDGGRVVVIGLDGSEKFCSQTSWFSTGGLAWTPKGDEVWVAAASSGADRNLISIAGNGKEREVLAAPGRLTLHEIAPNGTLLISSDSGRREAVAGRRGEVQERNISWFDWSWIGGVSADGRVALLEEQGAAVSGRYAIYVRATDGGPATRVGEGRVRGMPFSPDGRSIAVMLRDDHSPHIEVLPLGAGDPREVPVKLDEVLWWQFYPDGERLLILGNERGQPRRMFEVKVAGDGVPREISRDAVSWPVRISQDGASIIATSAVDGTLAIYSADTGERRAAAGCTPGDVPIEWSDDNRSVYVHRRGRLSIDIERVDVTTGERVPWQTIRASDPAGILDIMPVHITPDGQTYVYGYRRLLSDLYLVTGLL